MLALVSERLVQSYVFLEATGTYFVTADDWYLIDIWYIYKYKLREVVPFPTQPQRPMYSRSDLRAMKNPTCDLRNYTGGQIACHHMYLG